MSLEQNKAIVRRLFEAFNGRSLDSLDEIIAQDYVDHPRQLRGLENYRQHLRTFYDTFPDSHENIEDMIAEGDKVWIRLKGTGTHTGEYRGLAPTGKKITWEAVSIWRIVDGRVVEMWAVADELDLYKKLGIIIYKGFPDEDK